MTRIHRRRTAAVLTLAAVLCTIGTQGAAAHVLLETATPNGDGTTTLTFSFEHGCEGAPTTGLDVTLPPGVVPVSTTQPEGWDSTRDGGVIRWSGTAVADGTAARFELVATVSGTVGQSFAFPTTQVCTEGSSDWVDTAPGAGYPAPSFIATAATLAPPSGTPGPAAQGASLPQALAAVGAAALLAAGAGWARRSS